MISSLLKIIFVLINADLLWFVVIVLFDHIILAFALFFAYKYQNIGSFYKNFEWITAKKIIA